MLEKKREILTYSGSVLSPAPRQQYVVVCFGMVGGLGSVELVTRTLGLLV